MTARMKNPALILTDAMTGIGHLYKAMHSGGAPQATLELVHLRASQINGCSACVSAGTESARKAGVADEKLFQLAAWAESDLYDDGERAALALTEAATRLADRSVPVPDHIWDAVADHYDEAALSAIILMIATTNMFNRINTIVREPAGATWS